jgi:Carboxypeptidase regulatory-like domain
MVKGLSLRRSLSVLGVLAALMGPASWATAGTLGGIAGIVTDAKTGAPIGGVRLEISSPSQKITVTTDSRGHYIALSLPPDDYTLTAEKAGYDTRSFAENSVYADQTQQYDLQLHPAPAATPN